MAHNKPYRDIEERPRKKDIWTIRTDALDDNTKLVRVPKWYLPDMYWMRELGEKKLRFIKKIKRMLRIRKARNIRDERVAEYSR